MRSFNLNMCQSFEIFVLQTRYSSKIIISYQFWPANTLPYKTFEQLKSLNHSKYTIKHEAESEVYSFNNCSFPISKKNGVKQWK